MSVSTDKGTVHGPSCPRGEPSSTVPRLPTVFQGADERFP
jgi:hypothetical protein